MSSQTLAEVAPMGWCVTPSEQEVAVSGPGDFVATWDNHDDFADDLGQLADDLSIITDGELILDRVVAGQVAVAEDIATELLLAGCAYFGWEIEVRCE